MMLKLKAEREEAERLRAEPVVVNPDQESLQRLKALQQGQQQKKDKQQQQPKSKDGRARAMGIGAVLAQVAADAAKAAKAGGGDAAKGDGKEGQAAAGVDGEAAGKAQGQQQGGRGRSEERTEEGEEGRAGPGPGSGAGEESGEGEDGEGRVVIGGVENANPYEGMSARQRKLLELRQKLQQCRKQNQNAVIEEKKRKKVRDLPALVRLKECGWETVRAGGGFAPGARAFGGLFVLQ